MEETLIVWGGEFDRTTWTDGTGATAGRTHNAAGFTYWLAGGGVKGGLRYGATDETGWFAEKDPVHPHDLHATMLHLLGLELLEPDVQVRRSRLSFERCRW